MPATTSQGSTRGVTARVYCKTRAFRMGYEDYRLRKPATFGNWGKHERAYEDGRQTAAHLAANRETLRPIPSQSRISEVELRFLIEATMRLMLLTGSPIQQLMAERELENLQASRVS